jgi:Serine aminopeptidase, S33
MFRVPGSKFRVRVRTFASWFLVRAFAVRHSRPVNLEPRTSNFEANVEREPGTWNREPGTAWLRATAMAIALVMVAQPRPTAAGRMITFRASDGRTLHGLFVEASQRPAPAVVLVPMLGRGREEWQGLAQRLADAQISSLAIDLPGASLPADGPALASWHTDVRSAVDHLASRPEVLASALGVAGASLGANLAVLAAAADPRIRSLALVSPSLDYRGVRIETPMRQYAGRPALLIASLRDAFSARTVRELTKAPPGPREARWAEATAHGTLLLAREPDLVRAIVDWFQRTLG